MKNGIYDIVSIRTAQAASDELFFWARILVGLNPDYETAAKVYAAYVPYFDELIRERYNSRLLGLWPFGPRFFSANRKLKVFRILKEKKYGFTIRILGNL